MDTANIPCVVFAYNRPDKLKRLLTSLKKQGLNHLIIFIDGPKNDIDLQQVSECRRLAEGVDWVYTDCRFKEENIGLGGLLDDITLVFQDYPAAIFIEDDCLPSPGFINYMRDSLLFYETKKEVFSIGGYQPIPKKFFENYHYNVVSCARFTCWGWATWKDRWLQIQEDLHNFSELIKYKYVSEMAGFDLQIYAREALFGKNDLSWDVIVALITYWRHFVHLLPVSGQIKNIGFDSRGTNIGRLSAILSFFYHNRNVTRSAYISHSWIENVKINCRYNLELVHFIRKVHSSSIMIQLHRLLDKFRVNEINKNNRINNLDLMRTPKEKLTKRALFSYIVHPFSIVRDDPRVYGHMNIWHAQEIVRNLNRLGYLVDVIDYRYKDVQINDDGYDLFIGHGGENFYKLCMQLKAGIPKIFFATGSYWEFHNEQEKKRFENLSLRKGKMLTYDRIISSDEEKALSLADGIIGIGNECTRSTYKKYQNVFMINGNALYDDFADWCNKDFENGRNNFLFFSGRGNVHKGLDLLIETFSQLNLHLWVCTKIEPQFYKLYSRELSQARNIHLIGWVLPRTKRYYEIIQKCNFVILPSCSEGQSQSIIECMWQGLIPVVSRYCGVDVDEYGYYIDPCTVEQIKKVVLMLSTMPVKDYIKISSRVRLRAQSQFSEETFSKNFRIVLMTLLNDIQKVG